LVIEKLSDVTFRIQRSPRTVPKVVHYNRLKKYRGEGLQSWLTTPTECIPIIPDEITDLENRPNRLEAIVEESEAGLVDETAEVQSVDLPLESEIVSKDMSSQLDLMTSSQDFDEPIGLRGDWQDQLVSEGVTMVTPPPAEITQKAGTRRSTRQRRPPKKLEDYVLEGEDNDESELPIWV
jgi:hypothetical protein